MQVLRNLIDGAATVGFATRGFDGERVTRALAELAAPATAAGAGAPADAETPGGAVTPESVEVMAVHFAPGERTSRHRHLGGQILVVLDGAAEVVSDAGRVVAGPGDVVVADPGEWHWHGAVGDTPMTHLAIHPQGPGLTERDSAAP
jgi:quercetin dioxygenase-like cupin family protein